MPITPKKRGRIRASGTSRITFRNMAMNSEIPACPSDKKDGWIPFCRPKNSMPNRKMGITLPTSTISSGSLVNSDA